MIRRLFKRLFFPPMVILAAAIMFFEEWLWDHLTAFMARLARTGLFRRLEAGLASLAAYAAMAVFLIPGLMLLPVKIAALWLMARGHALGGLLIIIAAKVAGTAIVARIFTVCRPALLTVGWFRRVYEGIVRLRNRLYTAIRSMPAFATALRWKNRIKAWLPRSGHFSRRWRAIGLVLRRKFSRRQ